MYRSRHFLRWCLGANYFQWSDRGITICNQCCIQSYRNASWNLSLNVLFQHLVHSCSVNVKDRSIKNQNRKQKKNLPCFRQKVRKTFCTGRRNSFNSKTSSTRQSTSPHTIGSGWFQVITCLLTTRKGNSAVNWSSDKGVVIKAWTVRSLQVSHANSNLLWSLFRVESTIRFNDLRCGAGAVHTWIWESCLPLLPPPPFSCSW